MKITLGEVSGVIIVQARDFSESIIKTVKEYWKTCLISNERVRMYLV